MGNGFSLTDVRDRFHISPEVLGQGKYSVVRQCKDRKTKELYAIKSIRKSTANNKKMIGREIRILREVKHPNIIRLKEVHEDENYLHLITELYTGDDLFDRITAKRQNDERGFTEENAANVVGSILDAIAYCHDVKGIVHRDLKLENLVYATPDEDSPIRIIDFGLSRHDTKIGFMRTKVGSASYVAPEVLNGEYTKSCDIWSIGVITYILLCGYAPFEGDSDPDIFKSIRTGRFCFPLPEWGTVSHGAKDFICSLIQLDQTQRPSASEAMKHRWIEAGNECQFYCPAASA